MTVSYDVRVERGERFWIVHVPEVQRSTQARTLREVESMARDLIAIMTATAADSFDVAMHIVLPDEVEQHLQRARALRREAADAQSAAAVESRAAARALAAFGLPLRDIGLALGVSYQRAHQLVSAV